MAEAARKRIMIDEFLAFEGKGDTRYELVAGQIVAMASPSLYHGILTMRFGGAIGQTLKPPCQVISEAGIILPWRSDTYYQADLAVTCSPVGQGDWATPEPTIIVEVLSPTTEAHDRRFKLVDYRHIPSVREIVLIASDAVRIEHWQRTGIAWTVADLSAGNHLRLDSIGFEIPIDALYAGLDFSANAATES